MTVLELVNSEKTFHNLAPYIHVDDDGGKNIHLLYIDKTFIKLDCQTAIIIIKARESEEKIRKILNKLDVDIKEEKDG